MSVGLVSLGELKQRVGLALTDTTEDGYLPYLIAQASALVENYCRRKFEKQTFTEYRDGTGDPWLCLRQAPVHSITSVYLDDGGLWGQGDDAFAAATLLTAGDDYALRVDGTDGLSYGGYLYRANGSWPRPKARSPGLLSTFSAPVGTGNVKIVYVAGWCPVPHDVRLAVLDVCSLARQTVAQGGRLLQSEGYEGYSYSFVGQAAGEAWKGYLNATGGAHLNRYVRQPV